MGLINFKREIKWDKDVMKVTDSLSSIWNSIVDEMTEKTKSKQTDEVLRHFDIDMSELREYLRDKEEWKRKQAAAIPHWIPVTDADNLPKKSTPCLVACNQWGGDIVRKATYLDSEKRFYEGKFDITEYVTHWMPSPEPPKEEDNDNQNL